MHETYRQITHRHSGVEDTGHGTDWCRFYGEVMGDNHPSSSCSLNQYHVWWENASHITTTLVGFTKQMIDAALRAFLPTLSTESKQPIATSPPGETKSTESRTATETKQPADDSPLVPWISPRRGHLQAQLEAKSQSASTVTEVASTTTLWNHERLVALARSVHFQNPMLRDVGSGILVRRLGMYHIFLCQHHRPTFTADLVDRIKQTVTCRQMQQTTPFPSDHGVSDWCRFFAEVCGTHTADTCSLESCRHQWQATTYTTGEIVSAVQSLIQTGLDSLALPTAATTRPASAPPTTTSTSAVPTPEAKTEAIDAATWNRMVAVAKKAAQILHDGGLSTPVVTHHHIRLVQFHAYGQAKKSLRLALYDLEHEQQIHQSIYGLCYVVNEDANSDWHRFLAESSQGLAFLANCTPSNEAFRQWFRSAPQLSSDLATAVAPALRTAILQTITRTEIETKTQPSATTTAPLPVSTYANTALVNRLRTLVIPPLTDPDADGYINTMLRTMVYFHAFRCLTHPAVGLTNAFQIKVSYYDVGRGSQSSYAHGSEWCRFYHAVTAQPGGPDHAPEACSLAIVRNTIDGHLLRPIQYYEEVTRNILVDLAHDPEPTETKTSPLVATAPTETKAEAKTEVVAPAQPLTHRERVIRIARRAIVRITANQTPNAVYLCQIIRFHAFRHSQEGGNYYDNREAFLDEQNVRGSITSWSYSTTIEHGSDWCRFYTDCTSERNEHGPTACLNTVFRQWYPRILPTVEDLARIVLPYLREAVNHVHSMEFPPVQATPTETKSSPLVATAPTETKAEAKTEVAAPTTHRERIIRIARRAIGRLVTDSTQHGCYLSQIIRFHAWRHSQEGGNYYDRREAFLTERNVRASIIGWSYSTTRESVHGSDWCRFYNDCVAVRSHGSTACQSTAFREWYNNVDLNADDLTRIVLPYLREAVNFVFSTEIPPAQASPVEPIPIETKTAPLAATSAAPTETKQSETWPRDRLVKVAQHAHNHPVNAYTEHLNTAHAIDQATTFHLFHCATVHADRNASDWTSTNFIKDTLEWIYYSEELPAEGSDWCRFYRQVFGPAQAPRLCNCNSINHAKYWIRRYTMSTDDMAGRIHATLEAAWNATSPIQPLVEDETKAIPMEVDSEPAVEDPPEAPGPPIDVDVTEVVSSDVDRARLVAVARAVNTTRLQRSYDAQTRRFLKRIAVYHAFRCIEPGRGLRSLDDESEIKRTYNSLRTDTHRCHHGSDWCEFYQDVTPPERNAAAGTHRARQCSISGIWVNMGTCTLSTAQLVHLTAGILRRALADTASNGPSAAPTAVASS
jgi:hypothetical protein